MKIDKIAQKRALAEYKGKQDYERLLQRYAQLDACYAKAMQDGNRLARRLEARDRLNDALTIAVIVLGGLLLVATCCVGLLAWGCK